MHRCWRWLLGAGIAAFAASIFVIGIIVYVQLSPQTLIVRDSSRLRTAEAIIVLGANTNADGAPTAALSDRLVTAVRLYREGKAPRVLLTGDDGQMKMDELTTMRRIALEQGIEESAITVDPHGYRTYESCKRANQIFNLQSAIVVTQDFHLPRALYLCRNFGLDVQGVAADLQTYQRINYYTWRDYLASFKAWIDLNLWPPKPPVNY
jgi:vancomycin permeability regulator SanA